MFARESRSDEPSGGYRSRRYLCKRWSRTVTETTSIAIVDRVSDGAVTLGVAKEVTNFSKGLRLNRARDSRDCTSTIARSTSRAAARRVTARSEEDRLNATLKT
jgi:hypothetical protein